MAEYDFLEEKVPLKIGIQNPETTMLKVLGLLMGFIVVGITVALTGFETVGVLLMIVGVIVTFVGQLTTPYELFPSEKLPKLNNLLMIVGIGLTFGGIVLLGANNVELSDPSQLSLRQYVVLATLGIVFVLYMEYNHASMRFDSVLTSATRYSKEVFDIKPVLNNYFKMGTLLLATIYALTILLLSLNFVIRKLALAVNPQFGHSVILHSVYVMAITLAIVFVPIGIFLLYYFEHQEEKLKREEMAQKEKEGAALYT